MRNLIISFGEVLWDLLPTGPVLGGAPANFAYRAASLGSPVLFVSRVGSDPLGRQTLASLRTLGFDLSEVQQDPIWPTGTVPITLDADRNPHYDITPNVAFDQIELTPSLRAKSPQAICVAFGTLIQRSPTSRQTLAALLQQTDGALRFLDLNLRQDCFTTDTIRHSLENADVLKLNEAEAHFLAGEFGLSSKVERFAREAVERWQLTHCVVTLGAEGALARNAAGEECQLAPIKVAVADPCGAGDAFSAGFIHALLRGFKLERCCRIGNALGAKVAAQTGATAPIPQAELDEILA